MHSKLDQIDSTGNITLIFKFKTLNRCKRLVDDAAAPTNLLAGLLFVR